MGIKCKNCHRPLFLPVSQARGYGWKCFVKVSKRFQKTLGEFE